MTKFAVSFRFCAAIVFAGTLAVPAPQAAVGQEQTIRGQVINTHCFFHGKSGAAYQQCAEACLKAGQDLAIYDDTTETVYFLVAEKPGVDPNKPLRYHIGKTVEVQGMVVNKANAHGLIVKEVKER